MRVCSGGVAHWARDGMIPSLDARLALRDEGIVLDEEAIVSTAIALHPEVVTAADVILTMTTEQKAFMAALDGANGKPVLTLRELAGETGDIADPAMQGEDVFRKRRSLFFKKMQIVRGCDARRNVLVYMVYSDRIIEGSPKNSTSSVPIMPWGGNGEVPKCGDWIE